MSDYRAKICENCKHESKGVFENICYDCHGESNFQRKEHLKRLVEFCVWEYGSINWNTGCDDFFFDSSKLYPDERKHKYCPNCGKRIRFKKGKLN